MTAAPLDLDALEPAEKAATPGPWSCASAETFATAYAPPDKQGMEWPVARMRESSDGGFIIALRNAAPALFAAARERDELREALEAAVEAIRLFELSIADMPPEHFYISIKWRGNALLGIRGRHLRAVRDFLFKARAALGKPSVTENSATPHPPTP